MLEQRVQLLQQELKEIQEARTKDMARKIQDHANGKIDSSVFLEHIEKIENDNKILKSELETIYLKNEREKQDMISNYKKTEYALTEDNSRKDVEIQKLELERQKIIIEKDSEFEKYKHQIESEYKELKQCYLKEKEQMGIQVEQANLQFKALQMISANESYLSPVSPCIKITILEK